MGRGRCGISLRTHRLPDGGTDAPPVPWCHHLLRGISKRLGPSLCREPTRFCALVPTPDDSPVSRERINAPTVGAAHDARPKPIAGNAILDENLSVNGGLPRIGGATVFCGTEFHWHAASIASNLPTRAGPVSNPDWTIRIRCSTRWVPPFWGLGKSRSHSERKSPA